MRRKSKELRIGSVIIGGDNPIAVQSMCNTDTRDVKATLAQLHALEEAGCDIARLAVPDMRAAQALADIRKGTALPLVADIHFDYRLALEACRRGVDKIRINPGNIGEKWKIKAVADSCSERGIPIRIGVNSGSVDSDLRIEYGVTPFTLYKSAVRNIEALEDCGFTDICVSLKASNVFATIEAYRLLAKEYDYPLHLGVTEAGSQYMGTIKSAAAFGALLCDGIGDTLRVSLTDDPVKEIYAAKDILKALGLHKEGVTIVSCPTCGRTCVDLISIAKDIEKRLENVRSKITVAVMGCAVNGPGEAREADIGIACGKGEGLIIKKGEILRKVPESCLADELIAEVSKMTGEKI
ncbi:MAG: flavodoxin-dependent (E)-4-hydroxy-3-methylbut-2-enyl-diphosphate synthase [Clostridiaceae bacterium]|nr:flavodoxin-dependent (E)-4-hydroxy-3-methylbut-2-enyl-diphosphate synthase [Clostridiaceae bacterium]